MELKAGMEEPSRASIWLAGMASVLFGLVSPVIAPSGESAALAQAKKAETVNLDMPFEIRGIKGEVLKVTNLEDSGAGSFREAAEKKGPRIIVFETSGEIKLTSPIDIRHGDVIIAGQTAPAPGITIRGSGLIIRGQRVDVGGLRIRPGDEKGDPNTDRDPIQIWGPLDPRLPKGVLGAKDVYVHDSSLTWGTDDIGISWFGAKGVVLERVLMGQMLHNSVHSKGKPHSKGPLIGHDGEVWIKDSILAHLADRNPFVKNGAKLVFVNNVVYNWMSSKYATHIGSDDKAPWFPDAHKAPSFVSVVGNVYIRGFNTQPAKNGPAAVGVWKSDKGGAAPGTKVFVQDNLVLGGGIQPFVSLVSFDATSKIPPVWVKGLKARAAKDTMGFVLTNVGAFPRDSIDAGIITSIQKGTGKIIDRPADAGGYLKVPVNKGAFTPPANPDEDSGDGSTNLEKALRKQADDLRKGLKTPAKKKASLGETIFNGFTYVGKEGRISTAFDARVSPGLLDKLVPGFDRIVLPLGPRNPSEEVAIASSMAGAEEADSLRSARLFTEFNMMNRLPPGITEDRVIMLPDSRDGTVPLLQAMKGKIRDGDVLLVRPSVDLESVWMTLGVHPVIVQITDEAMDDIENGAQIEALIRMAERQLNRAATVQGGLEEFEGQRVAVMTAA